MDPWIGSNPYHKQQQHQHHQLQQHHHNNHHHTHHHQLLQSQSQQQQQHQYQQQPPPQQRQAPAVHLTTPAPPVSAIHHRNNHNHNHHPNHRSISSGISSNPPDMPAAQSVCGPGDKLAKMKLTVKRVNENRSSWTVCETGTTNHHHHSSSSSDNHNNGSSSSRSSCGGSRQADSSRSASIRSSSHVSDAASVNPAGHSSHYQGLPDTRHRSQSPLASSLSSSSSSSDESNDSDDDDDKSSDSDSDSSGSWSDRSCSCSCSSSHSSRSSSPCPRSAIAAAAAASVAVAAAKSASVTITTSAASPSPTPVANGKGTRMKDKTSTATGRSPASAVEEIHKLRRYRIPVLRGTDAAATTPPAAAADATSRSPLVSKSDVTSSAKSSVIPKSCTSSSKSLSKSPACQNAASAVANNNKSSITSHQLVAFGKERRDPASSSASVTSTTPMTTTSASSGKQLMTAAMSGSLSVSCSNDGGNQVRMSTGNHCDMSNGSGNRLLLLQPAAAATATMSVDVKPLISTSLPSAATAAGAVSPRNANAARYVTSCNQMQPQQHQQQLQQLPLSSHQSQPQQQSKQQPLLQKAKRQESQPKHVRQRQSHHNQSPLPQQQAQQVPELPSKPQSYVNHGDATGSSRLSVPTTPITPVHVTITDPLAKLTSPATDMGNMSGAASPASVAAKSCLPAAERQRLRRFRIDHLKAPRPEQGSTRSDCDYLNQIQSPAVPSPAVPSPAVASPVTIPAMSPVIVVKAPIQCIAPLAPAAAVVNPIIRSVSPLKQVPPLPVPHVKSSGKSVATSAASTTAAVETSPTTRMVQKAVQVASQRPVVAAAPSPRHQSCSPVFDRSPAQPKHVADVPSHHVQVGKNPAGSSDRGHRTKSPHASKSSTNTTSKGRRSSSNRSAKASSGTMTELTSSTPSPQTSVSSLMSPDATRYTHSYPDRQQMRLILPSSCGSSSSTASTMTEMAASHGTTSTAAATMAMMMGGSSNASVSSGSVYPVPQEIFPSSRASSSSSSSRSSPDLIPAHVSYGRKCSPSSSSLSLSSPSPSPSSCRSSSSRAAAIAAKLLNNMHPGIIGNRSTPPPPASSPSQQSAVYQQQQFSPSPYHRQQQHHSSLAIGDVNRMIDRVTSQVSGLRLETSRSAAASCSSSSSSSSFHLRVPSLLSPASSAASLLVNDIFKHRDYLTNAKREQQNNHQQHNSGKQITTCKSSPQISSSKHQQQYSSSPSGSSCGSSRSSPTHHRKHQQQSVPHDPLITREMMPGDSGLASAAAASAALVTDSISPVPSVNPVEVFVTEETSDFCPQENRGKKKNNPSSVMSSTTGIGSGMRKRRINKTGWDRVKKKKTSSSTSSSPAHMVLMSKLSSSPLSSTSSSSSSSSSRDRKSATMTKRSAVSGAVPVRETRGSVIRDTMSGGERSAGASSPLLLPSGATAAAAAAGAAGKKKSSGAAAGSGIVTTAGTAGRGSAAAGKGGEVVTAVVQGDNTSAAVMSPDLLTAASSFCGPDQRLSDDASPVTATIAADGNKTGTKSKRKVLKPKKRGSTISNSSNSKSTSESTSCHAAAADIGPDATNATTAIPGLRIECPADVSTAPDGASKSSAAAAAIPRQKGEKPVSTVTSKVAVKIKLKAKKQQQQKHKHLIKKQQQSVVRKKGKGLPVPTTTNTSPSLTMDQVYDCDTAPSLTITKSSITKIPDKVVSKVRKVRRCSIFKPPVKKYLKSGLLSDDYKIDLPDASAVITTATSSTTASSCSSSTTSDPAALHDVILAADSASSLPSCPESLADPTDVPDGDAEAADTPTTTSERKRPLLPQPAYCHKELFEKIVDFLLPYDVYMFMHAEEERKASGCNNPVTKTYKKVKQNAFGDVKPASNIEQQACECKYPLDNGSGGGGGDDAKGCGSGCLNRLMCIECDPNACPCREKCSNQRMQKHDWSPGLERFLTKDRGWGVRTTEPIKEGEFIMEYIGEVVSHHLFRERMSTIYKDDPHHYCLNLDSKTVIDGYRIANEGRFVNHSCEPNCEMQKWSCNGYYRVGLFSLRDIKPGEELSYDYNFESYNSEHQQVCHCGSSKCRGVIGGRKKQSGSNSERRTSTDSVISGTTPAEPSSSAPAKKGRKRKSSVVKSVHVSATADLVADPGTTPDLPHKRHKQDNENRHLLPPPLIPIRSTVDIVIESVIKMESDDALDEKDSAGLGHDLPVGASPASAFPLLEPKMEPQSQSQQQQVLPPGSSGSETKCNPSSLHASAIDRMVDMKATINHSPRKRLLKVLAEGVSESKPSS